MILVTERYTDFMVDQNPYARFIYFETEKKTEAKRVFETILEMEPDETVQASVDSYLDQLN